MKRDQEHNNKKSSGNFFIQGMAESTVAAVQAALNKKQVDLYELQVSSSSLFI
jgi:hypothetical protein